MLEFDVIGEPAPQGSKRHVGRGIMVESSKKVGPWRDSVSTAAAVAMYQAGQSSPIDEPVEVRITFRLRRPLSTPRRVIWPFRKPDIDKLLRSSLDALTAAGVISDDARVVSVVMRKEYATQSTGAHIVVEAL